jgi:hypothetical protein
LQQKGGASGQLKTTKGTKDRKNREATGSCQNGKLVDNGSGPSVIANTERTQQQI